MKTFTLDLIQKSQNEVKNIEQSTINHASLAHQAFNVYLASQNQLIQKLQNHSFSTELDEIYFFKELKPKIASNVLYYSEIFHLESKSVGTNEKVLIDIFKKEQEKCYKYFKQKKEYFNYYKTNNNLSDQYFFLRKNCIHVYKKFNNIDFTYSTGYDQYFITIIAYEALISYFQSRIDEIQNTKSLLNPIVLSELKWTADQVDLVEIIYALKETKAINNGNVTIKKLIQVFEYIFDFKIKDYARSFLDIKNRNNNFVFLESCIEALERKIDREL